MIVRERITINPGIQRGKPVIRDTRVPVARIIAELAGGMAHEELMSEYGVSAQDVAAALAYAAELAETDEPRPLPAG